MPRPIVCAILALLGGAWFAAAGEVRFAWTRIGDPAGAAGAVVAGDTLLTWGERLTLRPLSGGPPQTLPVAAIGACWMDVDGDGRPDLVVNESSGALAWYRAPGWTRSLMEEDVDAPDLMPATLFGQRGVLLIHRRMIVRHYTPPANPAARWQSRDLYAIYTPSWQGGLALADVDRDGRPDILVGNYWMRAPERAELPWPLFAINTWTEEEPSGMMRLAPLPLGMAAAQRDLPNGRVAWFERPANPRLQWTPHLLGAFDRPELLAADFDGDGALDLLVAERGRAGRLVLFTGPAWTPHELRRGRLVLAVALAPHPGRLPDLVLVTAAGIEVGRNVTAQR